jgi:3-hydroxyethyl bacteriochlorophyllide a dehydrogenase
MGSTGTAFVFPEANKTDLKEFEIPALEEGEILIEIECSGVSIGTERQIFYGQDERAVFPVVTGYQSVGIVKEMKGKCSGIKTGGRVLVGSTKRIPGINICWGSHVSHAIMNCTDVIPCPSGVKPEVAALTWLAGVGNQGADKVGVKKDDLVAIVGQGMIGQMAAQLARVHGARKVIATDIIPMRVELSGKYSADVCVNAKDKDIKDLVFAESSEGADVVYEATGKAEHVVPCLEMVKPEGGFCFQGWYPGDIVFPFTLPHDKSLRMAFPFAWGGPEKLRKVSKLIAGKKVDIEPLITHHISYRDAPKLYPDLVSGKQPDVMAIVIDWRK